MWGFEHLKIVIPTTWGHFLCQIPSFPPLFPGERMRELYVIL